MLKRRWATLVGMVATVVLLTSVSLAVAQEGRPPLQPAGVVSQGDTPDKPLWNQLDPVFVSSITATVPSYVTPGGASWTLAADDFVVTNTGTLTDTGYAGWTISQVVVRGYVDWPNGGGPGTETASVCFYADAGNIPAPSPSTCYTNLTPAWAPDEAASLRVMTFTLAPSGQFVLTNAHIWLSVQMGGIESTGWYWRYRPKPTYSITVALAAKMHDFWADSYPNCQDQWQVQVTGDKARCVANGSTLPWPKDEDLSFQLIGRPYYGTFDKYVYLPLVRR